MSKTNWSDPDKFCESCKYFSNDNRMTGPWCDHNWTDPVFGESRMFSAHQSRTIEFACGAAGRGWEAKHSYHGIPIVADEALGEEPKSTTTASGGPFVYVSPGIGQDPLVVISSPGVIPVPAKKPRRMKGCGCLVGEPPGECVHNSEHEYVPATCHEHGCQPIDAAPKCPKCGRGMLAHETICQECYDAAPKPRRMKGCDRGWKTCATCRHRVEHDEIAYGCKDKGATSSCPSCLPIDAAPQRPEPVAQDCKWTENEDGAYETGCGNTFELNNGTPKENAMWFCCYCGKRLMPNRLALRGE